MIFKVVSLVCFLALCTRAQHHEATSYVLSNLDGHDNVGHVQQTAGTYLHKYSAIPIVAKVPVATYKNYEEDKHYAPAHYEFKYAVEDKHTGDIKSQHEVREGDVVKGEYSLHEADGTVRTVKYTADKHSGFNAVVERTGHASHPQVVAVKSVHQVPLHHGIGSSHGLGYYH